MNPSLHKTRKHGNQPHYKLFARPHQPSSQRQIRRPRARTQALRGPADDDSDGGPRACLQNVRARLLAHAAYTERQDDIAVYGHFEVGGEGEQVRLDAGEGLGKAGR